MLPLKRSRDVLRLLAALSSLYAVALSAAYFLGRTPKFRAESAWFIFGALVLLAAVVHSRIRPATAAKSAAAPTPPLWLLPVFIAGAFALYWSTLRLGFLSDDFVFASRAIQGDFWSSTSSTFFRPLQSLLFAALSSLFGRSEPVATARRQPPAARVQRVSRRRVGGALGVREARGDRGWRDLPLAFRLPSKPWPGRPACRTCC